MGEGINRCTLLGNLGADPEVKTPKGGQALLQLRLATNETYIDKENKRQSRTEWHRVAVWGRRAEGLARILKKGDMVLVEGRIQTRSWKGNNGETHYMTEIVASNVIVPGTGVKGGENPAASPRPSQVAAAKARRAPAAAAAPEDDYDYGEPARAAPAQREPGDDDPELPFS